uniref:glycosyltransferase family 39 protein n=1 Tax=Nonomuraea pusilla TaxID=46177 RepID=UPI0006E309DC|nr:glycosyltransferase family 39 protein [Nonomuraea pusilla]
MTRGRGAAPSAEPTAATAAPGPRAAAAWPAWAVTWVPAAVAAALGLWGLSSPSLWRDESVSGLAALMPLARLRDLLSDLDAVHALYYLLLRPFAAVGGPAPEVALRLPSVLAFAAAAAGVAALGRRLAGPLAGGCAGLVYALTPVAVRYAQEARSYALVSTVAVLSVWLLLRLCDRPSAGRCAAYGASVALLGWLHLYALLLVPAHLVTAHLVTAHPAGARPLPPRRPAAGLWVVAALAGAAVALAPLVLVAAGQRDTQVFWLRPPGWADVAAFPVEVAGGTAAAVALFGLAAWGARYALPVVPWAVLPPALSMALSQAQPIYHPRYVLFAVPAVALLAGVGLARLPFRAGVATAAAGSLAFALLVVPAQTALREPGSRPDDLRGLAATLAAEQRPGDAVLFVPRRFRLFVAVYGEPYRRLADLTPAPASGGGAAPPGADWGTAEPRTAAGLRAALAGVDRVWLVSPRIGTRYASDERYRVLRETLAAGPERAFGSIRLTLYTRARGTAN